VFAGFELSKNKWGVDISLFIVITHRRFSIINNGGGLKLTPQVSQGILFGGLSKQLGGSTPRQFKHWVFGPPKNYPVAPPMEPKMADT
jgi:hypothetical protein